MSEGSRRYETLDFLRAFSAIGIVLMHVLANGGFGLDGFVFERLIPSFTDLVFLFMIISGFSMCCGYYDKVMQNGITVESFYRKRFGRMFPFFALMCVIDFIISPGVDALFEVFADLTLCFGFLPGAGNISVIGVGWFLGVTFVFYIIFPFFCFLISNKKRAWCTLILSYLFSVIGSFYFGIDRTNIVYCGVFFICGGLIFLYREKLSEIADRYRLPMILLCIAAAALYYTLGNYVILMLLVFSLIVICCLGADRRGAVPGAVIRFISGISMEIYLSHMMIYRIIELLRPDGFLSGGVLSYIVISAGTIAGAVMFSWLADMALGKVLSFGKGSKSNG